MTEDQIERLVAEFAERRDDGEDLTIDEFVADHPGHGVRLVDALRMLESTESLFSSSGATRFGAFRVKGDLGRGGMGRVLRVEKLESREGEFALKILDPAFVLNPRALTRFQREGENLRRVSHPGIVRVHEIGVESGTPYILMDLVDGENLAQRIRRASRQSSTDASPLCERLELGGEAPTAPRRVATMVAHLARAVAHAHDEGLLHRDLKPSNVILRPEGQPVLLDFGLARGDSSSSLTKTGDLLGTPSYMSPEQARGERATERSDVYGLGAILYECLALRPPYEGDAAAEVLHDLRTRAPASVMDIDPALPTELATIVRRALAPAPRYRYSCAKDLAEDLEAFAQGRAIQAKPPGLGEGMHELLRHRRVPIAIAIGTLLTASILIALATRTPREDVRPPFDVGALLDRAAGAWLDDDYPTLKALASSLADERPEEPAVSFLDSLGREAPFEPTKDAFVDALIEGETNRRNRDFEAAVSSFDRAVALSPTTALATIMLGRAAYQANDHARAERELTAATRLLPEAPRLRYYLARVDYDRKNYDAALASIQEALRLDSSDYRFHRLCAKIYFRKRLWVEGIEAAETALSLSPVPDDPRILDLLATLYSSNGQGDEARDLWRTLLDQNPNHVKWWFDIALSLDYEDRLEEAQEAYEMVLDVDPDHARTLGNLAFIRSGANRHKCEDCEIYFEENPDVIDFDEAEELVLRALDSCQGAEEGVVHISVDIAKRVEDPTLIREKLEELLRDASQRGVILILQKYLKKMPRE